MSTGRMPPPHDGGDEVRVPRAPLERGHPPAVDDLVVGRLAKRAAHRLVRARADLQEALGADALLAAVGPIEAAGVVEHADRALLLVFARLVLTAEELKPPPPPPPPPSAALRRSCRSTPAAPSSTAGRGVPNKASSLALMVSSHRRLISVLPATFAILIPAAPPSGLGRISGKAEACGVCASGAPFEVLSELELAIQTLSFWVIKAGIRDSGFNWRAAIQHWEINCLPHPCMPGA